MNLTFECQVEKIKSQRIENISLNYSDKVKLPFSYKQIENIVGIQNQDIGSKYIATNSLMENVEELKKVQDFTNVPISKEEWQQIKETYFNIVKQELQDSNFSKIEEANSKGYKLTLNGENLKNIFVKLLDNLKNDPSTLDKINEYLKTQRNSSKIVASDIDNLIKDINNNTDINDKNLEITIYQKKRKVSSIVIKIENIEIKLEKNITGNDLQYNLQAQVNENNQTGKIAFNAKFEGLQSMQSISENYELTLEMQDTTYQYHYNNNVEFIDNTNIESFNAENSLIIDEIGEEERNNLINAVMERIQSINESQMQELGLGTNENPIIYAIPQINMYSSNFGAMNTTNLSEVEVNTFNSKFENYESTNLKGVTVKGLLSTIQVNNENQENKDRKIKEIHFDGQEYEVTQQNITLIKSSIETQKDYRVEFERDENTGVIYRAVINQK